MFDLVPRGFGNWHSLTNPMHGLNSFFDSFWGQKMSTDVKDMGTHYLLQCELPGVTKDQIKVSINGNKLVIQAQYENETEEKNEKNGQYIYRERQAGSYQRSFDVSDINVKEIKANYENGILSLELPKLQPSAADDDSIEVEID